ncbi:ring finger domain-containing protein [Ditylenchus destructor]|uniref:Ring finger domain-containing protein n=1 Tax=Ditylenchus destructor TaxID=166010 RepID=A0AAD4MM87_9BILA|nr:ring finger domain-containing protein [Ditylenchus destructor]
MREVFLRAFLLVAYCALVIAPKTYDDVPTTSAHAPTTSEIYKVEVLDFTWKDLYKIVSFNTAYVSIDALWNKIYQIPYIARRWSDSVANPIYITIITPGQPFTKINNKTSAASKTNVYVADTVVLLSTEPPLSDILYVTKDELPAESEKSKMPKSKTSGKTLVTGKKTILLDFIRYSTPIQTSKDIWYEGNRSMGRTISEWSADLSVWHNVHKIRVKTCDRNGKVITKELLKESKQSKQLKTENGGIYVDLEHMSQPGSESGVKHIVPLWISLGDEKGYYVGVFRFTENMTKRSIWQKMQSYLSFASDYRTTTLIEVRIEMIGIENLVITENDENDTTSPVNFENAIGVVFTVRSHWIVQQDLLNNTEPPINGLPAEKLESLPKIAATQEQLNKISDKCAICLEEFKEKEALTELPCGHFFHHECVKPWLFIKAECPICRMNITDWDFKKNDKGKA